MPRALPPFQMRPEVQLAYDRFAQAHHGEIDVGLLSETMYNAGARAITRELTRFGDILPLANRIDGRLHQILGLLEGMVGYSEEEEPWPPF